MQCTLLDVFSNRPLGGNGLAVFECDTLNATEQMLSLTREVRQFESIFFTRDRRPDHIHARIFTMQEELDFAGHPLLGLAAHLHAENQSEEAARQWHIHLPHSQVVVNSYPRATHVHAVMQQGRPHHITVLDSDASRQISHALNLRTEALANTPMEVISTGLPYLIVPVKQDLDQARIVQPGFAQCLSGVGARFVYVIDVNNFEGRTWDNDGQIEDIATGSAAGPAAAYLHKHGFLNNTQSVTIQQGRFVHRPCHIDVQLCSKHGRVQDILVGGDVVNVAQVVFNTELHL